MWSSQCVVSKRERERKRSFLPAHSCKHSGSAASELRVSREGGGRKRSEKCFCEQERKKEEEESEKKEQVTAAAAATTTAATTASRVSRATQKHEDWSREKRREAMSERD